MKTTAAFPVGYLCLVLHAHLPYVRHPENDDFLEEDWLYEAMTETYLPLLEVFERLKAEGIPFCLTLSISPTLAEMLSDALLQHRFEKRLRLLMELAGKDVQRTSKNPYKAFHESAQMYRQSFERSRELYHRWNGNLLRGFGALQKAGCLEIITTAATHGFLPLMSTRNAVYAQVHTGARNYQKHFGCAAKGLWLPECAYNPNLEDVLAECGLTYFFLETHGVLGGSPAPEYGVYAPVRTPVNLAAFARDVNTSRQVWSREIGYPGDFEYREFYRDLGYDGYYDYIRPYLHSDGVRRGIGIKYHRITGESVDLSEKLPYRPALARERAAVHAGNFLHNRLEQLRTAGQGMDRPPLITAPFDAELFGHWWYEGPIFIEALFRLLAEKYSNIHPITPSDYLALHPPRQTVQPAVSTWGHKGYNDVWLNENNDWIYRHLHQCESRMVELAKAHPHAEGLLLRALNQAARELLLAQSSDWAFIMTTNTASAYARRRTREHIHRFLELDSQIGSGMIQESFLKDIEWRDNLFAELDYRIYTDKAHTRPQPSTSFRI